MCFESGRRCSTPRRWRWSTWPRSVGVGGAVPSYSALADAAIDRGATVAEIVEVLVEVISVVGLPRVVAEAPKLALAVGYDTDEAFEARSGP